MKPNRGLLHLLDSRLLGSRVVIHSIGENYMSTFPAFTLPASSVPDPRTQAFPTLTEAQINRIRPVGKLRKVEPGEILFEPNDTEIPFFVMLSGTMEIVQPDLSGERPIVKHDAPGEFTGEMAMISGARCLVRGRVTEAGEFLEVSAGGLRSLVAKDAKLQRDFYASFYLAAACADQRKFRERGPDGLAAL